ncbi:AAA domain-containing protein [Schleiferiaceae bacterium]|nr:AAA domain-containing protein [Schleiferiaceae bacterium]
MIGQESKERILKRLQQENARSPYLNSLPGRLNSFSKIDLSYLSDFNLGISKQIAASIKDGGSFVYHHDPNNIKSLTPHDNSIQKGLKNIVDKAQTNLKESGSETLAVGYPILLTRSSNSTSDCKAIPLFIWPVTIKTERVANRWRFSFSNEVPNINQSLIGHIESDQIPLNIGKLYEDFINETIESLDTEKSNVLLNKFVSDNRDVIKRAPEAWDTLERMPFETKTAMKEDSDPGIKIELYNSAVLTNYKESKYSIIKDFNNFGDSIPDLKKASAYVGNVSANRLDPSQSGVIEDINTRNHVVLHGPPGTGKSQTITGIITAGLANNLKIAVVCQKAAAINVLIENLSDLGITEEVMKITNISTDRKAVIEKARGFEGTTMPRPIRPLESSIQRNFDKIGLEVINGHLRTREEKLTEYFNWNESVGKLSKFKRLHPDLVQIDYSQKGKRWSDDSEANYILADELDDLFVELSNFGENIKFISTDFKGDAFADLRTYFDQVKALIANNDSHIKNLRTNIYTQQEAVLQTLTNDLTKSENNLATALKFKSDCSEISRELSWLNSSTDLGSLDPEIVSENIIAIEEIVKSLRHSIAQIKEFTESQTYSEFSSGPIKSHIKVQRAKILTQQEAALETLKTDLSEAEENFSIALELKRDCERSSSELKWLTSKVNLISPDSQQVKNNIKSLEETIEALNLDFTKIKQFTESEAYAKYNGLSGFKKFINSFKKEYKDFRAHERNLLSISSDYDLITLNTIEHERLINTVTVLLKAQEDIDQLTSAQLILFEKHEVSEKLTDSFFNRTVALIKEQLSDLEQDLTKNDAFDYEKTSQFDDIEKYEADFYSNQEEYKLFKTRESNLLSNSSRYQLFNLSLTDHDELLNKLNTILSFQKNIDKLASDQVELFEKNVVSFASHFSLFEKTVALINKHLADIKHDLNKSDTFSYEKTSQFEGITQYEDDRDSNLFSKRSISESGRLLNTYFSDIATVTPDEGLAILNSIHEKALHLEGVISLFEKSRLFESQLKISARGKISFKDELTYGILQFATGNHYAKHKSQLPSQSFNNKIVKQGENLQLIQKDTIAKALYNGRVRRVKAIESIEGVASSFARVFSFRGKSKKTLRQITKSYKEEFTELFPVIMMTPEVSCNLFEASHSHFDLVIVDEASQVELHDILPVLYKGKTLVIAGDQHQMPPSNFFSKQIDLDDEDEEDDMEPLIDVESLLEFCQNSPRFKSRFLDFHYRSNHAGLITFSNDAIYKRLVIKPTKEWNYAPFLLSRVHNGSWVNQRNEREALRVINLIKDLNINQHNVPHILVATLNAPHRKEIQDQIASEVSENPQFEERMQLLDSNGFDIKNLENLQGDECDLLIISTGYGPSSDGRFRQNLGVINREKGYRLLNVLITRAKFKVILVTSIPKQAYQSYVDVLKSGKIGRGLLYTYIAFVEAHTVKNKPALKQIGKLLRDYGIQNTVIGDTRSQNEFESPFEEEVYDFLIKHFDSSLITLQEEHINSGFRIDMVLKPNGDDGPRIAIECDGATFHSGWRNQTLDLHRQNLLEDAGYSFVRIWSTDWWRAQDICEASILAEIKTYLSDFTTENGNEQGWLTLKDEVVEIDELEDFDTIESIDLVDDDEEESYQPVVSKDCIVNLSSDNSSIPTVVLAIVPNQGRISQNSNGIIQQVFNSELPIALIGSRVGESIKFKNTTYTVESIE